MKRIILFFCLLTVSCGRVPEGEFHIEGRLAGVPDSTVLELIEWNGNTGRRIAKDTIIAGRFSFVVPLTEKAKLGIAGAYGDDRFPSMTRTVWAEPGKKARVRGDNTLVLTWSIKSPVPEQREDDRYMLQSKNEYDREQLIDIEDNFARKIEDPARRREVRDSLRALEDENQMTIFRNDIVIMESTPVSDIWLDKLRGLAMMIGAYEDYTFFRDDAVRLYEKLTPEQQELPVAQTIRFDLFPPERVEVGDAMADAELKALDGTMHKLSDYLGKYIIFDFWGSACAPCLRSMPELRALAVKYPDNLRIIGLNLDTSEEAWKRGTENFGPTWLNLNVPPASDLDERYGVNGIPHVVIVSPDGVVLESWSGYTEGMIEQRFISASAPF